MRKTFQNGNDIAGVVGAPRQRRSCGGTHMVQSRAYRSSRVSVFGVSR